MIANEFGEAANDPIHRAALIAAGLVLFVLTLLVNVARALLRRPRAERRRAAGDASPPRRPTAVRHERRRPAACAPVPAAPPAHRRPDRARAARAGDRRSRWSRSSLVIYYLLKKGLGALSWHFFTTDPTGNFLGDPGGIKSAILGTIEIVALATRDRGARSASASRSTSSSTGATAASPASSATSST